MSHLKKIDHVSYAVESGSIEKWAWLNESTMHVQVIRTAA